MTDTVLHPSGPIGAAEPMLKMAHYCLSAALQFDYLSNGVGHRQSTALSNLRGGNPKDARAARRNGGAPGAAKAEDEAAAAPGAEHDDSGSDWNQAHAQPISVPPGDNLVRRYLTDVARRRRLSSSEEYRLARATRDGDAAARQRLIECHLGFVVMIARRYHDHGLPLLDRIEEGNIGLLTAIEKFDPELGNRLSTYAKWWVRQSIELALMTQSHVVHVPVYVTRALKRSSKARKPAPAQDSGLSTAEPDDPDTAQANALRDSELLRAAEKFLLSNASNQPNAGEYADSGDPDSVLDSLAAPEHEQPDWRLHLVRQRQRLLAALMRLNDNERVVIRSRYGLGNDDIRTLESVAAELRVSPERVRQIQAEVLPKLRRILLEQGNGSDSLL